MLRSRCALSRPDQGGRHARFRPCDADRAAPPRPVEDPRRDHGAPEEDGFLPRFPSRRLGAGVLGRGNVLRIRHQPQGRGRQGPERQPLHGAEGVGRLPLRGLPVLRLCPDRRGFEEATRLSGRMGSVTNTPARIQLALAPTPIMKLERVSRRLGVKLYLERDDLTGLLESGNKIRKLEFLVGDALAQGADTLITVGTLQSNCCRAVSAVAARARPHAVPPPQGPPPPAHPCNPLSKPMLAPSVPHLPTPPFHP